MTMQPGEIARDYKAAKNKRQQIKILAELNQCDEEDIKFLLEQQGVEIKKTGRKKKEVQIVSADDEPDEEKEQPEEPKAEEKEPEAAVKRKAIPDCLTDAIAGKVEQLQEMRQGALELMRDYEKRAEAMKDNIRKYDEQLRQIEDFIKE